ncbi:BZ3500_MvSof-1268-A1-R1_Chr1-3g01996 [Microbotryum saponariae]|uniref:BZ3500_MvSof-1268-A1-R1_Chr1-3g01996 protein n=1 Tax=Microbotryum saponariae TaxID=289078 RepID=A0A2X0L8E6_9BASI|nr:BZ3500_MvSof-1268-A1-R1_Chr1-3g01996 [Microbotryum saponariae]SCZ95141.1 BZ3501_MvSof-1269-A2-R1_Chr1-3g01598 [Microbotryum saponariae]
MVSHPKANTVNNSLPNQATDNLRGSMVSSSIMDNPLNKLMASRRSKPMAHPKLVHTVEVQISNSFSSGSWLICESRRGARLADASLVQFSLRFNSVDLDRSGAITHIELKQALMNGDFTPFSDETIKMLLNMFDNDRSGTIGFNEFAGLWNYIKEWQNVFRTFDRDRSGTIESYELANALNSFGFALNPRTVDLLQKKFNPPPVMKFPGSGAPQQHPGPPGITFDAFVRCCVTVRQLSEAFQRADTQRSGFVTMGREQFLDMVSQETVKGDMFHCRRSLMTDHFSSNRCCKPHKVRVFSVDGGSGKYFLVVRLNK